MIKLILKKSRVVFYLRKIKESEQALNEAEEMLEECIKQRNMNANMGNDKKMVEFLQQKVYFQRALIYTQSGQHKEAASLLYQCLEYGSIYNITLKIKCLKHMEFIFSKIPNFENEAYFMRNLANFHSPHRRDFLVLIDSTSYLLEKLFDVMKIIKELFNVKMVNSDAISIYRFDEHIQKLNTFKKKKEIILEDIDEYFDEINNLLKSNANKKFRNIFSACHNALEDLQTNFRTRNTAKYN